MVHKTFGVLFWQTADIKLGIYSYIYECFMNEAQYFLSQLIIAQGDFQGFVG